MANTHIIEEIDMPQSTGLSFTNNQLFSGNSQMHQYVREFDWSETVLGPINQWPQSLKTAVDIILNSQHPMWIGWGPQLIFLYNDAYISVLGSAKHPTALGKPAAIVWAEIWDVCGPLADKVLQHAEATYVDAVRLFMQRTDYLEETYYSFSYSPIRDESGNVGGLFCPSTPVTEKLLSERRLKTLGELSSRAFLEKSKHAACAVAMETLAKNTDDIPFALLYLLSPEESHITLFQTTGVAKDIPLVSPSHLMLAPATACLWPIQEIIHTARSQIVSIVDREEFPLGLAKQRIREAIVLPLVLSEQASPIGLLIVGVNPCRKLDKEYSTFYDLVANQVTAAIQNAKIYEEAMERAEKLAEIDKAKTVFFSNVSHELRTPLTLILSPLEDALDDTRYPLVAPQRERIELIQRNGLRLLKLVNSLLDFSRIEAKRVQAIYEPTDLVQLTIDLASLFRSTLEKAGLNLLLDMPPLDERVYVDKEMWEKIIFNLLSNAFKFTLNGSISIQLKKYEKQVELCVQDTGVGIPDSELPRLFERFHRVEGSLGRSYEGTGIGLALIQELIKLHGGSIKVESKLGQGTAFHVFIPLGYGHLPNDQIGGKRESYQPGRLGTAYIEEAARWIPESPQLSKENLKPSVKIANPALSSYSISNPLSEMKPRILLADDNADMRHYVKSLLEPYWQIEAVENGEIALQCALNNPPDLVVSDVMMPKLNGFELLQALRTYTHTQVIPILLLSARAGEEAKIEGLQAGADDYLVKPFTAKELLARVEALLKIAQIRKAAFQREQELLLATQAAQADLEQVLANLKDGFIVFDRDWRFVYANEQTLEFSQKSKKDMFGKVYWDLYPDVIGTSLEHALRTAMQTGQTVVAEFFYPSHERWYENRIYPHAQGICVFSTDVTPRKRLEYERAQAIELANQQQQQRIQEAENYRRKQEEFIDTLCHELRNPLNGIYGSIAIIKESLNTLKQLIERLVQATSFTSEVSRYYDLLNNTIKEMEEVLRAIDLCTNQQKEIINDVLDLSKLENNKVELNPVPFEVKDVVQGVVQMFQPQAKQKNLQLILMPIMPDMFLKADSHRLTQIITNLISNAIKFTPAGSITLSVWLTPISIAEAELDITITDTGIGMSLEEQQRLFDRFVQANRRTTREFGGSGLGLAISKKLVETMGGQIQVSSQPGQGSRFHFTIRGNFLTAEEKAQFSQTKNTTDQAIPIQTNMAEEKTQPIKVLIVEDNVVNQKTLSFYLRKGNFTYEIANNGEEAVEKAKQASFDIIFMDIQMPRKNGLEATQEIRVCKTGLTKPTVPIIGLSGNASEIHNKKAKEAGMNNYLTKPYTKEQIYQMVEEYVLTPSRDATNEPMDTEVSNLPAAVSLPIKEGSPNDQIASLRSKENSPVTGQFFTLKKPRLNAPASNALIQDEQAFTISMLEKKLHEKLSDYRQLPGVDHEYIKSIHTDIANIKSNHHPCPILCLEAHINMLEQALAEQFSYSSFNKIN